MLPDCPPLWRAFARLAYECSTKKAHRDLRTVLEIARVHCQCLRLQLAQSESARWCQYVYMIRLSDNWDGSHMALIMASATSVTHVPEGSISLTEDIGG